MSDWRFWAFAVAALTLHFLEIKIPNIYVIGAACLWVWYSLGRRVDETIDRVSALEAEVKWLKR